MYPMSRKRLVSRDLNPTLLTLPYEPYDYQADAIVDIVGAFDDGVKVVVLEAPTGSGKTLIAETVRRELETRACYVCHNKDLQTQFHGDFPYSKVLYGRDNYVPTDAPYKTTCRDCTWNPSTEKCLVCATGRQFCPYQQAKAAAVRSPVPVLNSAYWLTETQNQRSRFARTGLVVFDEADTLEKVLMGQVEIFLSEATQLKYRIEPPKRLTIKKGYRVEKSYGDWAGHALDMIAEPLERLQVLALGGEFSNPEQSRELARLEQLQTSISQMQADIAEDIPWVYTGGAGSARRKGKELSFKPVKVDKFGQKRIWSKDKRFLLMSATIVSAGQTMADLGWDGDYRFITVESQFHPRNRQVVVKPVVDMSRKGQETGGTRLRDRAGLTVSDIIDRHDGERGVIHSVSYDLAKLLLPFCEQSRPGHCYSYTSSRERAQAIAAFKARPASLLVAPSVERGVDLPGELCRFQIIAKVPYPNLGDLQVQERVYNTRDGNVWYNMQVARTIMQMVGRGVRRQDDYCTCYIIDSQFMKWYKEWGHLLPKWFKRGIRIENE